MATRSDRKNGVFTWTPIVLAMLFAGEAQGFGRFSYSLILPPLLKTSLHSVFLTGTLGTINVGAYLLGSIFVTWKSKAISGVRFIRIGLATSVVGLGLFGISSTFLFFSLAMALMGFGGAMIWISSPALAAGAVAERRKGWAIGLVGGGIGIAITLEAQVAKVFVHLHGTLSWRALLFVEAGVGALITLSSFIFLHAPSKVDDSVEAIDVMEAPLRPSRLPKRNILFASYMAYGFVQAIFLTYIVTALNHDHHYLATTSQSIFSLVGFISIFGGILAGRISDRNGDRGTVMSLAFIAMGIAGLSVLSGSLPFVIVGAFAYGFGMSGVPNLVAAYIGDYAKGAVFARTFAMVTLFFGITQAIGPQIGSAIASATGSFKIDFAIVVIVSFTGAVLAILIRPKRQRLSIE
ncbi:MAG: MFS transporter [Actinomycetota bacterium]|nr:MFS transporter [Actinomycetota bacterium]